MIQDFTRQYVWLTDEQCFINTFQNRKVSTPAILRILASRGFNDTKSAEILETMKLAGITRPQLKKPKANAQIFIAQSYSVLSPHLGLVKESVAGVDRLYSIDKTGQVTAAGDMDPDKFRSLLVANKQAYEKVVQEFEESAHASIYQTKFTLKTFVDALYSCFIMDPNLVLKESPALISWSASRPAFRVLDPAILVPGPTPNWDSFLARMDFPETFKAFLWAVFNPQNTGRQSLWIKGPGSDGKSSAVNAISAFLGRNYVHSITKGAYDGQFFYGGAYGKRLSIYMDCKNPHILTSEKIKSMLGRDSVDIDKKFQHSFTAQLENKLMVLGNIYPKINYNDNSEKTRLLLCEVQSYADEFGDSNFEYALEAELPAFLVQCQAAYKAQCPNDVNLRVPAAMAKNIKLKCAAKAIELMERFLINNLDFDKVGRIPKIELLNQMTEFLQKMNVKERSNFTEDDFTRLLGTRGVVLESEGAVSYFKGVSYKTQVLSYKQI